MWDIRKNDSLILTTQSLNCGDGHLTHWKASRVSFSEQSLTAVVDAVQVPIQSAITDVHMGWGTRTVPISPVNTSSILLDDTSCGLPDASTINGLPAVPCGNDFDTTLDDAIGYLQSNNASLSTIFEGYINGLSISDSLSQSSSLGIQRRSFDRQLRRGLFSKAFNWAKAAGNAIVNFAHVAQKAVEVAADVVTTALNTFVGAMDFVADVVDDGVYEGSIDKTANLELVPPASELVDSPWGKAYPLYHQAKSSSTSGSLDIYCKDCGVTGEIHMAGELKFSICEDILRKSYRHC